MKKIISACLALAMIFALGVTGIAATPLASPGDVYEKDMDGEFVPCSISYLSPGKIYYIYVGENEDHPAKTRIEYICQDVGKDKKISLISSPTLRMTKKKIDGAYRYFAELRLKDIPINIYDDEDIYLSITNIEAVTSDGTPISFTGSISEGTVTDIHIQYESGYDIGSQPHYFEFDDITDTIVTEDQNIEITVNSEGLVTKMLLSCDTSYDDAFLDKYSDTNMEFYKFEGGKARRPMDVRILKNDYTHLYERTENGLKEITRTDGDSFVFRTSTLGSYVLADNALPASSAVTPTTPQVPSLPTYPSGKPTGGIIIINPPTGVNL